MNKYKKLIDNSIIFTIGNFGSRVISFVMVPLYTSILSTEEYGTIDLAITTLSLLLPLVSLEIGQAVLRFAIDFKSMDKRKELYNNSFLYVTLISIILILLTFLLININVLDGYSYTILLVLMMFNVFYSNFIRGLGEVKAFALSGIIQTLTVVLLNILFLIVFKLGINGYFISLILSYFITNVYMFLISKKYFLFSLKKINYDLYSLCLKYSLPLIPNSIIWWIINGTTRFFILFFIDASANGLFAVANKIPSLINIMTNIFTQAWQLSSFEEYNSEDKDEFYSSIFNIYSSVMFIGSSILMFVLKPIIYFVIDGSYFDSWMIIPSLIFSVIYQSLAGFLGTNYTAAQETRGAFSTSLYAGGASLILNSILIPTVGVMGAGIGMAVSFIVMFITRYFDTKKYVKLKIQFKLFFYNNLLLLLQAIVLFFFDSIMMYILEIILLILMLWNNKNIVTNILNQIKKMLSNKI